MALTIDEARQQIINFCATYPVAAELSYKLRETQEELYGPQATREAVGTLLGAYLPRRRRVDFAVANFRDASDFERTLRHEVLGHYGINTFTAEEKRQVLDRLIASQNTPQLDTYWQTVNRLYTELPETRRAEEVYAFVCENILPDVRVDVAAGEAAFRAAVVEQSRPMQYADMVAIATMVAEGLHDRSRRQQIFPATDHDQFRKDDAPRLAEHPVWLAVPHDARDVARQRAGTLPDGKSALGFDSSEKLWYARPGCELERVRDWLPDTSIRTGGGDARSEFYDALTQAGLLLDGLPVMDGKRHRVATLEDKHGQKSGVYRGFLDRRPGGWFINYHRAETEKSVTNWKASGTETSPIARLHLRASARQARDDAARERQALYAQKTAQAARLYQSLPAADPLHPYLGRKGIPPTPELRQTRNGALVVPFFDVGGAFKTLQYITADGDKRLYADAPKQSHFLVVGGEIAAGNPILYAEGYATARSLNLATGLPVVMTIDAGNMVAVAKVLGQRYPQTSHLFMADLDHTKTVNKGLVMATQAAAAVKHGTLIVPAFTAAEKAAGLTDFNDIHQSRGLDGLRKLVGGAITRALTSVHKEIPMQQDSAPPHMADGVHLTDVLSPATQPDRETDADDASPAIPDVQPHQRDDEAPIPQDYADWAAQATSADSDAPRDTDAEQGVPLTPTDVPVSFAGRLGEQGETPAPVDAPRAPPLEPKLGGHQSADPETEVPALEPLPAKAGRTEGSADDDAASPADGILVGAPRPRGAEAEVDAEDIDKDALLGRLSHAVQADRSVLYSLDGEAAFVDKGTRIDMAPGASGSDEKIIAALLTAAQFYRGRIELTGSDAFKQRAIDLIARHDISVTMKQPAQQAMLTEARAVLTAGPASRDAVTGEAPPLWGATASPHAQAGEVPTPAVKTDAAPASAAPASTTPGDAQNHALTASTKPGNAQPHQNTQPDARPGPSSASDTAPPSGSGVSPAIHQSYSAAKAGVTGKVLGFGPAPFRFDDKEAQSVYIQLRTREGKQTFWGKELAGLLRDSRVQKGSMVTLQWLGKQPVSVKVPKRDEQGNVLGFEDKTAHRNQWALTPTGGETVRTGSDEGVSLSAFDANRFAALQAGLLSQLQLPADPAPVPRDGVLWLRPDGQGSLSAGDALTAPRPQTDNAAGTAVITGWGKDGQPDLYLVRSDGPYLQGLVRVDNTYQHVLVSLPGSPDAPAMVFNVVTDKGLEPIGYGNGINRSGGKPVARDSVAYRIKGDSTPRIAKLDAPAECPPGLHARLGFNERWRDESQGPKPAPVDAPKIQPATSRPA
ncbi:LPD7 domain-containing protein [Serratia ureilytica]|uniref:LPD7 domain-containing protein n=1 Tax=Serratia ureilytica TaxID=300181 RepID=UPI001FB6AB05|nr:LPD7 domain-containing protein [Serratia ureilytica]